MPFILLTGAGFSYNWGGPLASEVFSQLLADKDIDDPTREMLFNAPGGFEQVLADLQLSADPADKKRHAALITAVVGIFNGMNNTFMHMQFEFENPPSVQHSLATFLSRFHAIFTLNQDALLEQHYNPHIGPPMNWGHLQLPGMRFMPPFQPSGARQDKFAVMEPNPPFRPFGSGAQPYVKLHGSVNWVESNMGQRILIMGGQKAVSIGLFPILTWYHEEFRKMLLRPSARLMIIGYSFSDSHINDAIAEGLKSGLKLFIIDPHAMDALTKDPRIAAARSQLIGFSVRPLDKTFGGDRVAHGQVSRFFDP
jgi:SIR2-like domain